MPTPDHYGRAKTLFLSARRLPTGERTRFLRTECADDAALEARVRRLLMLEDEDPEFLEKPAVETDGARGGGLVPGTRLGAFRIVRVLGEGGMGVVYEAQQEEPGRRVALKLIRAGFFSERLRSRFRHEVRILGQLRHPGIAQIYEAGTLEVSGESVPYFAMELIEGRPLLECARALGVRERLALIAQVCDAVHHAHQKGVIHRDLKPGNILVEAAPTAEGTAGHSGTGTSSPFQVKILDFGVARAIDTDSATPRVTTAHTHAGELIGTLPYMSPEQAAADPSAMDIRSDVYSIGVIACEVLTGRLPYDLEGKPLAEAARAIAEQEPARLGSIDRALRGDAETIVAKALQKDPRHRYQSAAELAADIRRHLRDEPIVARPASALYQLRKFARRHKPLVVAAAVVLVAMVGATVVSAWQARVADRARVFAEGEQERADSAAAAALREAHRATLVGASAAFEMHDPITANRLLDGTDERSRDWAWRHWRSRLDECVAMASVPGPVSGAWMSPDASEVAMVSNAGVVYRGSPWSGALVETARLAEAPARRAAFVDQGRRVVTNGPSQRVLTLFDAQTGRVLHRHERIEDPLGLLMASADGRVVLAGPRRPGRSPGDVLWLLRDAGSGAWEGRRVNIGSGTSCASITGDGRWLALGTGIQGVMTWDAGEPEPRGLAPLPRGSQAVVISDDGSLVATGGVDKAIGVWDRAAGTLVHSLTGHTGTVTALAFDPGGRTLASAGVDMTIRLWEAGKGASGRALATFTGQTGPVRRTQFVGYTGPVERLQFSADGAVLMSASDDGTIRLWRRDPFDGTCILRGHTSYVYAARFTPDGARIVSCGWDGVLRAWNAADGRPLGASPGDHGYITALGVSPDGRTIATGQKSDGSGRASSILVWDAATLRPTREIAPTQGEISDLIFSADSARLYASRESGGVDEFDLATAPPARRAIIRGGTPDSIALAPDGTHLACGHANGSVAIVSVATGEVGRRHQPHAGRVRNVAFHPMRPPTRPLVASASDDGTACLWDPESGRTVPLRGHADAVYSLAFSPDGAILATGSEDTTIVLWDVDSGDELTRLRGHDAYVYSLAFSPDGSILVSGSGDHTVRIWDTQPVRMRWQARGGAGR